MRYVQRDKEGKVIGHFSNIQEYAVEILDDEHPDILAFNARRKSNKSTLDDYLKTLEKRIIKLEELVLSK